MKSSIVNKSFLAVVMLMVACLAGFAVVGEDTDAAEAPYTVSIDGTADFGDEMAYTNASLKNNVAVNGNVITGSVTEASVDPSLGFGDADHFLVFSINGVPAGYYVTFAMSSGAVKSVSVGENDQNKLDFLWAIDDENRDFTMTYAVTPTSQSSLAGLQTYSVEFDLQMDVKEIQVEYTVNGLTIIQRTTTGAAYSLVALDALNQAVPEGKKFVGWSDGTNTYPVGTILIIDNKMDGKYKYEAIYEDLPVQEVFQVEFIVDGIVSQTCMSDNVVIPANPSKEGFKFLNWAVDGVFANPANYAYTENTQFVAQWEAYVYTITFMAGGEIVGTPQTVKHGDLILAPALPAGYESWSFDFTQPIKADTIIVAVEAPEPEPTGADNPMTLTVYILVAFVIVGLIACFVYLLREGKLVIGRGSKVVKVEAPAEEEPKQ